jgi:hypothetical protein
LKNLQSRPLLKIWLADASASVPTQQQRLALEPLNSQHLRLSSSLKLPVSGLQNYKFDPQSNKLCIHKACL